MRFPLSFTVRKCRPQLNRNTKALVCLALTLAWMVAICGTTPLLAQSPSYPDFSSVSNLVLNPGPPNGPAQVGNVLRLTPATTFRVGSAWFGTLQPVANGFSTTFTFKLTDRSDPPADGIAFVIQSAGTDALGQAGGYLGYGGTIGGDPNIPGIVNSLAIEFDTYANSWDANIAGVQPANHVAVQSCPNAANTVDHAQCSIGIASAPVTLSDGAVHVVRIEYTGTPAICIECSTPTLQVFIDDLPVFDAPLQVDLSQYISFLGQNEDSAYVGLTGATGASYENHDILSWIFTPHGSESISKPAPKNVFTPFIFGSYLYKVKPDQDIENLTVTEVPTDYGNFNGGSVAPGSKCIIYANTGGKCVEFHAECTGATCNNVNYEVVTSYDVPSGDITKPGFLKATGQECTPEAVFDQNIITDFIQTRTDPTTKGSSKPTFSCFVAVQGVDYLKADLDILNLASSKVKPNTNLTYVATVTDFGPSSAQGVSIKNTIPNGTMYQSSGLCTLSGGCSATPCTFDGTAVRCSVGNLAKFGVQFMVVTVKVTAPAGTIIRDTATVDAFNPDPDVRPDRSSTMVTTVSNR